MKTLMWLLVAALLLLGGYFVYNVRAARSQQASVQDVPVNADSIGAYQLRLERLRVEATQLRVALGRAELVRRPGMERQLELLESRIRDLSAAIEQWRSAKGAPAQASMYQKCILMYGKASGVCDALALDTLPHHRDKAGKNGIR